MATKPQKNKTARADLDLREKASRKIRGGGTDINTIDVTVIKTTPAPIPIPYPNTGTGGGTVGTGGKVVLK